MPVPAPHTHEPADHDAPADPACAMAHGDLPPESDGRALVAVFASPVADLLLHFGREAGYATVLVEPDQSRISDSVRRGPHRVAATVEQAAPTPEADVVVTDHDRPELGQLLRDALAQPARWVGVMGSPRHPAPHLPALRAQGIADSEIARVHRPIGLNIGSHSPAEIAISTLAGLIADRNRRPGGFDFS